MMKINIQKLIIEAAQKMPPEKRTLKNIPKYSTGKLKVSFVEWLGLKGQGSQGYDGKYYGWSHRAVYGFSVGDTVKMGNMSNKFQYSKEANKEYARIERKDGYAAADKHHASIKFEPYKIKDAADAKEHALRFADAVS